jgi:hypothetical protein
MNILNIEEVRKKSKNKPVEVNKHDKMIHDWNTVIAEASGKYNNHTKICFHNFQVKESESEILEVSELYRNSGYIVSTIEFDSYNDWYYVRVSW